MTKVEALLNVMQRLRDPESGCPWDVKQTFQSIAPYTIEEAYEVADAIERDDHHALCDELGDLLLQVVFHAQIASDRQLFDFDDVADAITQKMVRRHPHVFGDVVFDNEQQQKAHWESIKEQERQQQASEEVSALDGVATALPALTRALKIQKRASRVGFDWPATAAVPARLGEKLTEEVAEFEQALAAADTEAIEEELGDLLFTLTNMARHLNFDPELALKKSTDKFERRFRHVETTVLKDDLELTELSEDVLDTYWRNAKSSV